VDGCAVRLVQLVVPDQTAVQPLALSGNAQTWTPDFTESDQILHKLADGGAGDRQVDALRLDQAGRIDADDLPGAVDQRAAAHAGVEDRIRLDQIFQQPPGWPAQPSTQNTDDPACGDHAVAIRIAQRQHEAARLKRG